MFSPARLKMLRKEKGFTQSGLANAAGISPTVISNYEAGNYAPSPETQAKLAEALSVQVSDIHEDEVAAVGVEAPAAGDSKTMTVGQILAKAKEDLAAVLGVTVAQIRLDMGVTG